MPRGSRTQSHPDHAARCAAHPAATTFTPTLFAPLLRLSHETVAGKGYQSATTQRQCHDDHIQGIISAKDLQGPDQPPLAKKRVHPDSTAKTIPISGTKKTTPKTASNPTTRLRPATTTTTATPPTRAPAPAPDRPQQRVSTLCHKDLNILHPADRITLSGRQYPKAWILTSSTATLVVAGATGAFRPRGTQVTTPAPAA